MAARYADALAKTNAAAATAVGGGDQANATAAPATAAQIKSKTALDSSVHMLLKLKNTLQTNATHLESKLRGDGKESEALVCLLKSAPCVGGRGRKRKFDP